MGPDGPPLSAAMALLCDADGCLFPSEEPAFDASVGVVNTLLAELSVRRRYTAGELRLRYSGLNFRAAMPQLCSEHGVRISHDVLERWVAEERRAVTVHLRRSLRPDVTVRRALKGLAAELRLAIVSSSALERISECLEVTGLEQFFPPDLRFSAEDSLASPRSKPDPAIYRLAGSRLGVDGSRAAAIEDTPIGAQAAIAAGFPVIGLVQFVPPPERAQREAELRDVGVRVIARAWDDVADLLLHRAR